MKNRHSKLILQLALASVAAFACAMPAAAESVYRCGDTYSQQPCPNGKVVLVEDARNASQRNQTNDAVKRDTKLGDAMEQARLKEEAKPAQVALPPAKPEQARPTEYPMWKAVSPKSKAKAKKPEQFTAVAPAKPGDKPPKKKSSKKQST